MALQTGLTATVQLVVTAEDTAESVGSGNVPVLATPRLITLCEQATVAAIADEMTEDSTTVGMRVQFDHLAPSGIGADVTAEATLERIEGRRLTFTVSASDARGLVGAGKVTRVMVDKVRFLERAT